MEIHQEWQRNLAKNRPDIPNEGLKALLKAMLNSFPGSLITIETVDLALINVPDSDDRHVVAAALQSQSKVILTLNLKDFPSTALKPLGIEAIHPDTFISALCTQEPQSCLESIKETRKRLKHPPKSPIEMLEIYRKSGLTKTVHFLQNHLGQF